jgi:hypothetical protein
MDSYDDDELDLSQDDDSGSTNPLKQVRDHAKKLQRDLRQARKELEDLRSWKTDRETEDRKRTIETVFDKVGLQVKHAELFLAVKPDEDPTELAIKEFAKEYSLPLETKNEEGDEGDKPAAPSITVQGDISPSPGFTPATTPAEAPSSNRKQLTQEEFRKLYETRPEEALQLLSAGRVELESLPAQRR